MHEGDALRSAGQDLTKSLYVSCSEHSSTVRCNGTEQNLLACSYNQPLFNSHAEDAGVRCFNGPGTVHNKPLSYCSIADTSLDYTFSLSPSLDRSVLSHSQCQVEG